MVWTSEGRQLTEDGTVIFKHIHPIEGFNMKGWDLSLWSRPVGSQDARVTLDVLNGIVGQHVVNVEVAAPFVLQDSFSFFEDVLKKK